MSPRRRQPRIPSEFDVEHEGEIVGFSKYTSKENGRIDTIVVERFDFEICPMCLTPNPDKAEHVPPESLGGSVLTTTCKRCNNNFGTAEEQLRKFIDLEASVEVRATEGSVQGHRAASVAFRSSDERPPAAFVRTAAPGFEEIVQSPSKTLSVRPLDMALVMAAALKHAYLAACLHQQAVPDSEKTSRVRSVLLAVREKDRDGLISALRALGHGPAIGWVEADAAPPVLLLETGDETAPWMFILGGRFVVDWPFDDVVPRVAALRQSDPVGSAPPPAPDGSSDVANR